MIFALGFHQQESYTKLPFFLAEHRKRLIVATYCMDKGLSTFVGRPPRMSWRYIDIELPLDMKFEDIVRGPEIQNIAPFKFDKDGWNTNGIVTRASYLRASFTLGYIRESILELFLSTQAENLETRLS
jgi:chromatin structure-remodeling complex subunit RSC3/30